MAPNRTYGKSHPEAKVQTPPGAKELRDGNVVYGYDHVVRTYRDWTAKEGKLSFSSMLSKRLRELERALPAVGREHWRRFIEPTANTGVARVRGTVAPEELERVVVGHILHVIPECPLMVAVEAVRDAIENTNKYRADTLGKIIGLKFEQRREQRIETIGACDVSKAERERLKAETEAARKADERRAGGSVPRYEYEGNSVSAFCRRHGIARSTYYNRLDRCQHPLTREPITQKEADAYRGAAPVQRTVAANKTEDKHYSAAAPVQSLADNTPSATSEQVLGAAKLDRSGGSISPPTEEIKTLVAPHMSNADPTILPEGGGQASSLPPARLETVTESTERNEPMTEQTSAIETVKAAGPDGTPTPDIVPEYRELAAEIARQFALTRDEAALSAGLQRLADNAARWGVTKGFAQEKADMDRRNDTFMLFIKHPAYATGRSVASRLAHADRTPEEIRTVLDIIGETPTMDETAGEMAVALFKRGHPPASVAMLLLNAPGMMGRPNARPPSRGEAHCPP